MLNIKNQIIIEGTEGEMREFCNRYNIPTSHLSQKAEELIMEIEDQNEFDAEITIKTSVCAKDFGIFVK